MDASSRIERWRWKKDPRIASRGSGKHAKRCTHAQTNGAHLQNWKTHWLQLLPAGSSICQPKRLIKEVKKAETLGQLFGMKDICGWVALLLCEGCREEQISSCANERVILLCHFSETHQWNKQQKLWFYAMIHKNWHHLWQCLFQEGHIKILSWRCGKVMRTLWLRDTTPRQENDSSENKI